MNKALVDCPRLILFHKQSTSGRTRFLKLPDGVVLFSPLPAAASLVEDDTRVVVPHPAALVGAAEEKLGLPAGSVAAEAEFVAWVETPEGEIPVLLAAFTTIDPPFEAAARQDGSFIALTEARSLTEIERQLLRRAYEHILG